MAFFKRTLRPAPSGGADTLATDKTPGAVTASKVLPRFFTGLAQVEHPVVLDCGPVVGPNVGFLGDELACKLHVEDFYADVESHARRDARTDVGAAIAARLDRPPASVDAVLCWDLFDYLDRASAKEVAAALVAVLRPGGWLHAFFGGTSGPLPHYTRFIIESKSELRLKTLPATPATRQAWVVRDIDRMFTGLTVVESVLLKSQSRETLFRKPA